MPNDYTNPTLTPAGSLNKIFEDSLVDLRIFNAVTLANLASRGRIKTTKDTVLRWEVRYGAPTASSIGIYAVSGLQNNSTVANAELGLATKRFSHRFEISRIKAAEAAARGVGALRDLFQQHINEAMVSILGNINNAIVNNDATSEIVSLATILDETAPYAGIDPAVVNKWVPIVDTAGTARDFSRDLMIDFDAKVRTYQTAYDSVWMHPTTETLYKKLFKDLAGANSLANFTNLGNLKGVDLGLGDSTYNNRAIIQESAMPTGQIRFLNTNGVELFFFDMPLGQKQPGMPQAIDEVQTNALGFPMYICSYPITVPTKLDFEFYTVAQLRLRNRQDAMAIKGLTTDSWVS